MLFPEGLISVLVERVTICVEPEGSVPIVYLNIFIKIKSLWYNKYKDWLPRNSLKKDKYKKIISCLLRHDFFKGEIMKETKVAIIGIIVEDVSKVIEIQNLLSEYSEYIIGRMGIPYKQKDIRIISVVLDAEVDTINALTGKIGKIKGINAKTVYSNI